MSKISVNDSNFTVLSKEVSEYAARFTAGAHKSAEGVLDMAWAVVKAKGLGEADFQSFCDAVGFEAKSSTIRKLSVIGRKHEFLLSKVEALPSNWTTIYHISRLAKDKIEEFIKDEVITPSLGGKGALELLGLAKVPNGTKQDNSKWFKAELPPSPCIDFKTRLQAAIKKLEELEVKVEQSDALKAFLSPAEIVEAA